MVIVCGVIVTGCVSSNGGTQGLNCRPSSASSTGCSLSDCQHVGVCDGGYESAINASSLAALQYGTLTMFGCEALGRLQA